MRKIIIGPDVGVRENVKRWSQLKLLFHCSLFILSYFPLFVSFNLTTFTFPIVSYVQNQIFTQVLDGAENSADLRIIFSFIGARTLFYWDVHDAQGQQICQGFPDRRLLDRLCSFASNSFAWTVDNKTCWLADSSTNCDL